MNLFVIGDVHGCFHTLQELIKHWQPATELLVQTGDIVDRGNYSLECLELARTLETQGSTVFLLGNHEHEMLKHYAPNGPNANWLRWGGRVTAQQYQGRPSLLQEHLAWIKQHPLFWTNEHLLISHAGFADTPNPLDLDNANGILWRRGPLTNKGKRQIIGHTPTQGQPAFDRVTNVCNIDTGAYLGQNLTALRLSATGELLDEFFVPTLPIDIA